MAQESYFLIQFSIRLNRLLESLDQLQQSIDQSYRQFKDAQAPRIEKISEGFAKTQKRLTQDLQQFKSLVQNSALSQNLGGHLDSVIEQVHHLADATSLRFKEMKTEEWPALLASLGQKAVQTKNELKSIDVKSALSHVSDAVLVDHMDHFEDLGQSHLVQWPRKIWHMLAALMIVAIHLFIPISFKAKIITFGCFTAYATIFDVLRLVWPKFNMLVVRDLKKFMRKREVSHLNSMTFYALSTFFVCLFFPQATAVLAVLFLGFGDTTASIVGTKWGRTKFAGRRFSLEGSLAFFATAFLISLLYPILNPVFTGNPYVFAFLAGLIGMASEMVAGRLDDNFVIPIFSALGIQALVFLL